MTRHIICPVCGLSKPANVFRKGKIVICRKCSNGGYNLAERRRWYQIKGTYGIDKVEWLALLCEQGGRCAICRRLEAECGTHGLYVDHSHTTKAIRGLLCMHCNTLIGHAGESLSVLENAIAYIEKHNNLNRKAS